jgi:hypothetical protein
VSPAHRSWLSLVALASTALLAFALGRAHVAIAPLLGIAASAISLVMYLRAHARQASRWLLAPFALCLAWSALLVPGQLVGAGWIASAAVPLAAIAVVAGYIGLRLRDPVLPGAVAWLAFAAHPDRLLAVAAVICAFASLLANLARSASSSSPSPRSRRA